MQPLGPPVSVPADARAVTIAEHLTITPPSGLDRYFLLVSEQPFPGDVSDIWTDHEMVAWKSIIGADLAEFLLLHQQGLALTPARGR